MKYVGAHVSASGGVENSPVNAHEIGAKAFALFTKNQKQWFSKPLTNDNIRLFRTNMEKFDFDYRQVMPHDSYLINLGNPVKENLDFQGNLFLMKCSAVNRLGFSYSIFIPGAHLKQISEEECMNRIAESVNITLDKTKGVISRD